MIFCSHFDVLSLQDNGGQHLSFFTAEDTKPFIAAYAAACRENNCRFWGNVESGELEVASARDFFQRFGKDGNCNTPECEPFWRPVPMDRLQNKLDLMSKYSKCNISWGYQAFYRPGIGRKAQEAYKDYEKYLNEFKPDCFNRGYACKSAGTVPSSQWIDSSKNLEGPGLTGTIHSCPM